MPTTVIDDAVLILSELLSNSCRYARPLAPLLDLGGGAGEELLDGAGEATKSAKTARAAKIRESAGTALAGPQEIAAREAAEEEAAELAAHLVGVPGGRSVGATGRLTDGPGEHGHHRADGGEHEVPGGVLVRWQMHTDGLLTLEVTDGGAPTRPLPASPSLTARGGRGLSIVGKLATDWGVRDAPGEVTVWAALPALPSDDETTEHARSA